MPDPSETSSSEPFRSSFESEKSVGGEYLKDEVEFIDRVSTLIEALQKYATPTRSVVELGFVIQEDGRYSYPEALQYRLMNRTMQGVDISITQEGDEPSTTTIEFTDEDGTLHVSRDSVLPDDSYDAIIDHQGKPQTIAKIPNYEINAFLLSLTGKHREAEHTLLQAEHEMVIGENMIAALHTNAVEAKSYLEYSLGEDAGIYFTMVNNRGYDKLTGLRLSYMANDRGRTIAEINLDKGLAITFSQFDKDESSPLYPEKEDYTALIDIVIEKTRRIVTGLEQPSIQIDEVLFRELSEGVADPSQPDN